MIHRLHIPTFVMTSTMTSTTSLNIYTYVYSLGIIESFDLASFNAVRTPRVFDSNRDLSFTFTHTLTDEFGDYVFQIYSLDMKWIISEKMMTISSIDFRRLHWKIDISMSTPIVSIDSCPNAIPFRRAIVIHTLSSFTASICIK